MNGMIWAHWKCLLRMLTGSRTTVRDYEASSPITRECESCMPESTLILSQGGPCHGLKELLFWDNVNIALIEMDFFSFNWDEICLALKPKYLQMILGKCFLLTS